jgi:hypothetical protein
MSTNDLEGTNSNLPPSGGPNAHHGYDPNQPRVPAGHGDGGQWTRTPGSGGPASQRREAVVDRSGQESWGSYVNTYRADGTLAEQRVFNRDRSRIVSEFNAPGNDDGWDERHTVILADGSKVTFQNSGDVQAIYDGEGRLISAAVWTEDGPQPLPVGQLAFVGPAASVGIGLAARFGPAAARAITAAALALYTWLSRRKDNGETAIFAFKAGKYENEGTKEQPEVVFVSRLTRDEVGEACKQLGDVQRRTDEAVAKIREDGEYKGPADFGTKVHKKIAEGINALGKANYRAEVSGFKSTEAKAKYGEKDTIRIDAYEYRRKISTVCAYDPKTGEAGLSLPRMTELAQTAQQLFGKNPKYIIVIEVRPGQE